MGTIFQGMIIGLTFAILLGPGFFALIQTSIHRGFRSGVFLAVGIFLSDLTALILCYLGASQMLGKDPRENFIFGIIGGIVLIIFGTYTFTRIVQVRENSDPGESQSGTAKPYVYVLKGFFLNAANPGVWFIWITVVVSVGANFGIYNRETYMFFSGILGTIFVADTLKCFIANKIKYYLKPRFMTWMNRIVGFILVVFGSFLILNVIFDLKSMIPFTS